MLELLRGVVRGAVAWVLGWLLTFGSGLAGLSAAGDGVSGAANAYIRAHSVPPTLDVGLLIVVVAVAVAGVRAGRSTRSGVAGRIRSMVQSIRGTELNRARTAAVAGAFVAVGYAVIAAAVALWLGTSAATALVGGLVYGLAVGVPGSVGAALY